MYGSPGPTSQAQYPIGSRTWFSLKIKTNETRQTTWPRKKLDPGLGEALAIPGGRNGGKVSLCYPIVPMGLESPLRCSSVLQFPKRPLVDDIGVAGIVE